MTQESFFERRGTLKKDRARLVKQLEDLDASISQLDKEVQTCERQVQQLREQLRGTTQHFENKIVGSLKAQRELSDEKMRAMTCKACVHMAIDVARSSTAQRGEELTKQLRRRRAELRRSLSG